MKGWMPAEGLKVHPGPSPDLDGGTRPEPFLDVPHWLSPEVKRVLRHHRVAYDILDCFTPAADSTDPDDQTDRLYFPAEPIDRVQALIDKMLEG